MAEINNPQVRKFANEMARGVSNQAYYLWQNAKAVIAAYNLADIGTLINNAGAGNLITDGSESDGRTRITGGDIFNLITALTAFVNYVEGGAVSTVDRRDVLSKPATIRLDPPS